MPVSPSTPQHTQAVIALVAAIAVVWSVIHWRTALKVTAIALLALVIYSLAIGFHDASSLLATHHQ